jgi:tyrosyl-tRNA synthetase
MRDFLPVLRDRGFLQQATPGLGERLAAGPITGYVGFDPTADSLHVGNLVPVMALAWLQRTGGTPIALVGAGTGMVGDPSGKRQERPVLPLAELDANAAAIRTQLARFLSFEGHNAARMRNNADWLRTLGLMEFLRDVGKHFGVGAMLQKESIRSRVGSEEGISYTEFSYMLIQAYDFWHLFRAEGCELQMGGSDQWGNITAGIDLIASRERKPAHGLVTPLITTASGTKFGKSEAGNVWLDPARTSPYQFYQFWLNADDRDVDRYLRLFTFLPLGEIEQVMREQTEDPSRRVAQRRLAEEATVLVHGREEAARAVAASAALFRRGGDTDAEAIERIAANSEIPTVQISAADLGRAAPLVDVLVRAGLASSKADGRRGIQGGGYYVNGEQVTDVARRITPDDFGGQGFVLLRKGKKNYVKLVQSGEQ